MTLQLKPTDPPDDELLAYYEDWSRAVLRPNRDLHRLGNTLFREWFLQREGYLLEDEVQPQLRIAASSVDVLLRKVEWRWDRVQLPWLGPTLGVDWAPILPMG